MRRFALSTLAALGLGAFGAMASAAENLDDAVVKCMFETPNASYVSVSVSKRDGQASMKFKKTREARKARISNAKIDKVSSDFRACVNKKMGKR